MSKEILNDLKDQLSRGEISKDEVLSALGIQNFNSIENKNHALNESEKDLKLKNKTGFNLNLGQVFSYLGSLILLLGIVILINLNWLSIAPVFRILLTFGIGVTVSIGGFVWQDFIKDKILTDALNLLSVPLIYIGIFIISNNLGFTQIYEPINISLIAFTLILIQY